MTPRNQRLINEVAVGLVIVEGPGELNIPNPELIALVAGVQAGLEALGGIEPAARVSWSYDTRVVTLDEEIFPSAPWRGMPKSFYVEPIDAALWRESNNRTYLFQGDRYLRMTGSVTDPGYPRPIAGNWHGLPTAFEEGIDAAFWHRERNKIYMFSGDQYVRLTESTVDAGYPKPIAGQWHGLPDEFASGIDAAFMHHGTDKIYMFAGDRYARLTGSTMDSGYPRPIKGSFGGLPEYFETGIQAALWRGDNDKVYLFGRQSRNRLNEYVRYSPSTFSQTDAEYPKFVGGLGKGDTEALWRDAALAGLGFGPGHDGVTAYADDLQHRLGTKSSIVAFVTSYPVYWPGYARTPKWVMAWNPDWTDFDVVVAHESGHLFGGRDEYAASPCTCSELEGRFFAEVNGNCANCAGVISMDDGYPQRIAGAWNNLPASFQAGIDAAVHRPDNGKVYMFRGDQYLRMSDTTMDPGYPKPIAGNWHDLPASFTSGIDAAVWRPSNDRLYFFKGPQYVRLTDTTMDPGYPSPIAGNWQDLPASFTSGIDAALWHETRKRIYLFRGDQYARMSNGVPCLMSTADPPTLCDYTVHHFGWGAFLERIDAAVYRGDNDRSYLFSGRWYARFTQVGTLDPGYPKRIAEHWHGLPSRFTRDLDAALWRESNGKLYLFKGPEYARLTGSTMDADYPKPIAGHWHGLPAEFEQGIDGALWRMSNDKIYLFKGNRYVRLTESTMDTGYPQPLTPSWTGLPPSYANGFDAALMRKDTDQIYFFNGRTYLRYSNVADGPDDGYPAWIDSRWMPFPR